MGVSHKSTELDEVPSHFVFDRVYIHGNPELNSQRGLAMNSRWTAVIDSWIDECHIHGFDSQAICTWNGPGPFKIENCFLEGGSENVMFGGAKNSAECMVASDVEIRRCHFYKNPAWSKLKYPNNWAVKNLFEHNVFERFGSQSDFPAKSAGRMFQVGGRDFTFRHNTSWNDVNMISLTEAGVDPQTYRVLSHSKAKGTATDGTDPGADIGAVMEATANVRARRP